MRQSRTLTILAIAATAACVAVSALKHECHHARTTHEMHIAPPEDGTERRVLQDGPFRLNFDLRYLKGLDADQLDYFLLHLHLAKLYFSTLLVPRERLFYGAAVAPNQTSCANIVTWKEDDLPNNYPDTDLIIFVKTEQIGGAAWAKASACTLSGIDYRPIVGAISFDIDKLQTLTSSTEGDFLQFQAVMLHEITHVLGFSQSLFPYFLDPTQLDEKVPYGTQNLEQLVKKPVGSNFLVFMGANVLRLAKSYFACDTLEGMPLEDYSTTGSGTGTASVGAHWEKAAVQNEYMTATIQKQTIAVSQFTLNLLLDSGWYDVNVTQSDPTFWGKGSGCQFLLSPCTLTNFQEFQDPEQAYACTFDGNGYGAYANDDYAASCNYIAQDAQGSCQYYAFQNSEKTQKLVNENNVYGYQSRCISSNVVLSTYTGTPLTDTRCLKVLCQVTNTVPPKTVANVYLQRPQVSFYPGILPVKYDPDQTTPYFSDSIRFECTDTDADVYDVQDLTFGCDQAGAGCQEISFSGQIACPSSAAAFCQRQQFCPNSCQKAGYCVAGTCLCENGIFGGDCTGINFNYTNSSLYFNISVNATNGDDNNQGTAGEYLKASVPILVLTLLAALA